MATDLFGKYFNNPKKSYIYTNLVCNSPSADELSFDIIGSEGQITDNGNKLAGIDLSDVHVPLSQYSSDMRILEPYSYLYIKGMAYGDTYAQKTYGRIVGEIIDHDENWMYNSIFFFVIKYLDTTTGKRVVKSIKLKGDLENEKTFVDVCTEYFEENKIPIGVTYDDGYVTFTSLEIGYDFWIDHVLLWKSEDDYDIMSDINKWIIDNGYQYKVGWDDDYFDSNNITKDNPYLEKNVYSSLITKSDYSRLYNLMNLLDTDFQTMLETHRVKRVFLFEDFLKRVSPKKYRNGALKGIVVKATYPKFNADDIYDYQRSLKIAHVQDSIEEYHMIPESVVDGTYLATRKILDVVDSYHCEYDSEAYDMWLGKYSSKNTRDEWIRHDELPQIVPEMFYKWKHSHVPFNVQALSIYKDIESRDAIGLAGYCVYLTKHKLWTKFGQFYCITSISDDESDPYCKNLIPGIVIYNPNDFPVTVNYATFV